MQCYQTRSYPEGVRGILQLSCYQVSLTLGVAATGTMVAAVLEHERVLMAVGAGASEGLRVPLGREP